MKAGSGSKAKGSAFERDVCKKLSFLISDGTRDDLLWRSAMSGGRATVRDRKTATTGHVSGDICAVHEDGYAFIERFYCECKHYKDLRLQSLLLNATGPLYDFWVKAKQQGRKYSKTPLLIAKQNAFPTMICMSMVSADLLLRPHSFRILQVVTFHETEMVLLPFSKFLQYATVHRRVP